MDMSDRRFNTKVELTHYFWDNLLQPIALLVRRLSSRTATLVSQILMPLPFFVVWIRSYLHKKSKSQNVLQINIKYNIFIYHITVHIFEKKKCVKKVFKQNIQKIFKNSKHFQKFKTFSKIQNIFKNSKHFQKFQTFSKNLQKFESILYTAIYLKNEIKILWKI